MLAPQDIQTKVFAKAVFGGYDMAAVDDFLEVVNEDYSSLYKDNAVLKGKIKVLVEKVEEYRSTEDAMRMALLTAQKMSDDIIEETKAKCDAMVAEAEASAARIKADLEKEYAYERARLDAAKAETAAFVQASRKVIEQYSELLSKLDEVTGEYGGVNAAADIPESEHEQEIVRSPEPEPAPARPAAPAAAPEVNLEETIRGIDRFVSEIVDEKAPAEDLSAETRRIDISELTSRTDNWNEDDELTTPRPKFDFSDLKFGSNYSDKE